MKINLDCIIPRSDSPRQPPPAIPGGEDGSSAIKPQAEAPVKCGGATAEELDGSKPMPLPVPANQRWISLGLPAAALQPPPSPSPRLHSSAAAAAATLLPMAAGGRTSTRLPDKIRHLGEILRSLDARIPAENPGLLSSRKWMSSPSQPYRRNWMDLDAAAVAAGSVRSTPRDHHLSGSVRTTPRDQCGSNRNGFDLRGQLNGLEEMLQRSEQQQQPLPRSRCSVREEPKDDRASSPQGIEMEVLRDVLARLGRIESLSQRVMEGHQNFTQEQHKEQVLPARVKQQTNLAYKKIEKNLQSFMSSVDNQMERTDAAVKNVEKKMKTLVSSKKKPKKISKLPEDQSLTITTADVQRVMASVDELRKQCEENRTNINLCWSAMNQLCVDNEAFRQELYHLAPVKSKAAKKLHKKMKNDDDHRQDEDIQDHEIAEAYEQLKTSDFPGWSCSGMLQ